MGPERRPTGTTTDNHGRHLGKSLFITEDCSRPGCACLPAAHDDVLARLLEGILDRRKAGDVADMRRVISAEFRMHRAGIHSDLHEHRQRVFVALYKFEEKRRTDTAVCPNLFTSYAMH